MFFVKLDWFASGWREAKVALLLRVAGERGGVDKMGGEVGGEEIGGEVTPLDSFSPFSELFVPFLAGCNLNPKDEKIGFFYTKKMGSANDEKR